MIQPCRVCDVPTTGQVTIDHHPTSICEVCCRAITKQTVAAWELPDQSSDDRNEREMMRFLRGRKGVGQ